MQKKDKLLKEVLSLNPLEKANIIDELIKSLDEPDKSIDQLWIEEAENRIDEYEKGQLKSVSVNEVFSKYKRT